MSDKPLLYNGFKTTGFEVINRIDKLFQTEVYKLLSEQFLYLFLDIAENDILNSQINIEKIKLNNKTYIGIIVNEFNINYLNSLKNNLTSIRGFNSIAGMEELKSKLYEEIILPFKNKENFKKYRVSLPNGLLFYGPPGCGKTYVSTKLAEELGWNFLEVKHSDIASSYIHGSTSKIGQVFQKAKLKSPVILFFDEISGLVPKRENISGEHIYKEEEINEFLMNLDSAGKNGVLVIGATNYPNRIDSAILRTGRFDLKLYIGPPDLDTRIKLFQFYLKGRPIEVDINYNELGELTRDYIISDIEFIVESASKKAAIGDFFISQNLLKQTIKSISSSISKGELEYFKNIYFKKENNGKKIGFNLE